METRDIVERARDGDNAAADLLARRHRGSAMACARKLVGREAAEDVVQESLVAALINLDRLKKTQSFGSWLLAIVRAISLQRLRRKDRAAWKFVDAVCSREDFEGSIVDRLAGSSALLADAGLAEDERRILQLHYDQRLECTAIGELLGVKTGGPPGPWAADPYRPEPNPATGELTVDPEIVLPTRNGSLSIEFFYNSLSTENLVYGQSRTASIESYVVSNTLSTGGLAVVRGNGEIYGFTGTQGGGYTPTSNQNSGTTIAYDATHTQYIETFPTGQACVYANQGEPLTDGAMRYDLVRIVDPSNQITSYVYCSGAEAALLKTIQVPTGQIVSLTWPAPSGENVLRVALCGLRYRNTRNPVYCSR